MTSASFTPHRQPGSLDVPCPAIATLALALLVVLTVAVAAPTTAMAQDSLAPRVLVLPFEGKGPPTPARVSQSIVRIAGERGARVSMAETGLAETSLLVGCDPAEVSCLDAMASALNVDHMVFGTVTRKGKGATVALTVTARQRTPVTATVDLADVRADARSEDQVAAEVARILAAFELQARAAAAEPAPAAPPAAAPAPPSPAAPDEPVRRPAGVRFWTLSLIAGGVVLAVGGGALWGTAFSDRGGLDDLPTATASELDTLRDREDSTELRLRLGGAAAIVGVAVAATGAVIALRQRRGRPEQGGRAPPSLGLGAAPLAGGAALGLVGRF